MQMGFGLYQEQTQKLIMTMQMKQAIEVLQCSALELSEYVSSFVEENPCAEVEPLFVDLMQSWAKRAADGNRSSSWQKTEHVAPPLEQVVQIEPSLEQVLADQVRLMRLDPVVRRIALYLIGCLNDHGYLTESDDTFTELLNVSKEQIELAIAVLQTCEPLGVAARNIQECLRLQLALIPENIRNEVSTLINHHLQDIASGRMKAISKAMNASLLVVQNAIDALRTLNPKPGLLYTSARPQYVIPDVIVEKVGQQFVVITNDTALPQIRFNNSYLKLLNHSDSEANAYIAKKFQSAQWLAKCLEQRRMTLFRVAEAILDRQQAFFHYGVARMKPLTLHQIADELGLHESTISRATRGKYMQTPRGVFEMKFFFTAELPSNSGSTSAQAAKYQIRKCIQSEDREHPYSDEVLVKLMAEQGIELSRRTVAKYREELDIPSSAKRRRY